MNEQEIELLESYRQLRPESKRLIMSFVTKTVTNEMNIKPAAAEKDRTIKKP